MDDDDIVTLSEIEHYTYCARQWALIHLEGLWSDNASTVAGHIAHERVDRPELRSERGRRVVRAMTVWSDRHRLLGRADTVEFTPGRPAFPVEHKSGRRAMEPAALQLAAQAVCLEEMFGEQVPRGALWLQGQRQRREIELTDELKLAALATANLVRLSRANPTLPKAVFDNRCPDCSLIDECLPRLVTDGRRVRALYQGLFDPGPRPTGVTGGA